MQRNEAVYVFAGSVALDTYFHDTINQTQPEAAYSTSEEAGGSGPADLAACRHSPMLSKRPWHSRLGKRYVRGRPHIYGREHKNQNDRHQHGLKSTASVPGTGLVCSPGSQMPLCMWLGRREGNRSSQPTSSGGTGS